MTDAAFVDSCLRAINDYRAIHQAAPLTLNAGISAVSQGWANDMARRSTLGHNPNAKYNGEGLGENCAYTPGQGYSGKKVAAMWYDEVKDYSFQRHSGPNTGHFTQLVWLSSREIGIARAQGRNGYWYIVANFLPPGNYTGRYQQNVLPPIAAAAAGPSKSDNDRGATLAGCNAEVTPTGSCCSGGRQKTVQRRQETRTEGGITKVIVTETTTDRDGRVTTTTTTTETTTCGDDGDTSSASHDTAEVSSSHQLNDKEFANQVVKQHNFYRRQHGNVGDLTLNHDLCQMAERWAQYLAAAKILQHSTPTYRGQSAGENIAFRYSSPNDGSMGDEVVKQWYDEVSKCNFWQPENAIYSAGHFTQVVWKGSSEIGVGRAYADNGQTVYIVCNYFPAGNVIGCAKENVFPSG